MEDVRTCFELETFLQNVRNCSWEFATNRIEALGIGNRLPNDWLALLSNSDILECLRATIIAWGLRAIVPREMQLRAVLANHHEKHILVSAGTGSGKTLPMALNILLDDPDQHRITITISPLKRLQMTQLEEFNKHYRIVTVVINEDTPRDPAWYTVSSSMFI